MCFRPILIITIKNYNNDIQYSAIHIEHQSINVNCLLTLSNCMPSWYMSIDEMINLNLDKMQMNK